MPSGYSGKGSSADVRDRVGAVEPVVAATVADVAQTKDRVDELTSDVAGATEDVGDLAIIFENGLI